MSNTANRTGICQGMEYQFAIRAVPSPMAYRARAILPNTTGRISGFGNTREAAVENMQNKIRNYLAVRGQ
jgi:hypothetical protein